MSRIRHAISENPQPFKDPFHDKDFKKIFKHGFCDKFTSTRVPKGHDPSHPDLDLIKLKSFFVTKPLSIKQFSSKNLVVNLSKDYRQVFRLNSLLEKAINGTWSFEKLVKPSCLIVIIVNIIQVTATAQCLIEHYQNE
jgi:uncharacterized protein (DUF2461 family)